MVVLLEFLAASGLLDLLFGGAFFSERCFPSCSVFFLSDNLVCGTYTVTNAIAEYDLLLRGCLAHLGPKVTGKPFLRSIPLVGGRVQPKQIPRGWMLWSQPFASSAWQANDCSCLACELQATSPLSSSFGSCRGGCPSMNEWSSAMLTATPGSPCHCSSNAGGRGSRANFDNMPGPAFLGGPWPRCVDNLMGLFDRWMGLQLVHAMCR